MHTDLITPARHGASMSGCARALLLLTLSCVLPIAHAHDPGEHARQAAAAGAGPDCAAMQGMPAMDPDDPVAQAVRTRCQGQPPQGDATAHSGSAPASAAQVATPHRHGQP